MSGMGASASWAGVVPEPLMSTCSPMWMAMKLGAACTELSPRRSLLALDSAFCTYSALSPLKAWPESRMVPPDLAASPTARATRYSWPL